MKDIHSSTKRALVLLALAMAFGDMPVWADTETVDGVQWTYTLSGGKATVGYDVDRSAVPRYTSGAIVIPTTLGGCPVTGLDDYAFHNCTDLTSVTIPEGVTNIGYGAFSCCYGLTNVTLPASVASIGEEAFEYCRFMESIGVADGNPSYESSEGVLFRKGKKDLVACPPGKTGTYRVPEGVMDIRDYAFTTCFALTSIVFPDSLESIGAHAFWSCAGLTNLTIPSGVTSIGAGAFSYCYAMETLAVSAGNARYESAGGVLFDKEEKAIVHCMFGKSGAYAVPAGVARIGAEAFAGCSGLTDITIPTGVASVGELAFVNCNGMTTLTVPEAWEGTAMLENAMVPYGCEIVYRDVEAEGEKPETVWRFYSKNYKGHFFTISEEEKDGLIAGNPNWKFEGGAYRAYTEAAAGTVALYRFYSKAYRGHFFTIDQAEMETVRDTNPNWKYEGVAYFVYPEEEEGTVPVYRFWSKGYRHHFYTIDEEEKETLIATNPNWKYEGEAFWALPLPVEGGVGTKVAREGTVESEKKELKRGGGVVVTTSDGTDGSAVADGDKGTGWSPEEGGDAWVVLSYTEPVEVESVDVAGENLPEGLRVLWSEDAEAWEEAAPMSARYVWVALPGEEAVPVLREILVAP